MIQYGENVAHAGQEAQTGLIWPPRGQIITHSSGRGRERDTAARTLGNLLFPSAPPAAAAAAAAALRNQTAPGAEAHRGTQLCSLIRLRGRRGRHSLERSLKKKRKEKNKFSGWTSKTHYG